MLPILRGDEGALRPIADFITNATNGSNPTQLYLAQDTPLPVHPQLLTPASADRLAILLQNYDAFGRAEHGHHCNTGGTKSITMKISTHKVLFSLPAFHSSL